MITKGIKTSEFWTTAAVMLGGGGTALSTMFDHAFLASHPVLAAVVAAVAMVIAGLSQIAYTVGRSLVKSSAATPLPTGESVA